MNVVPRCLSRIDESHGLGGENLSHHATRLDAGTRIFVGIAAEVLQDAVLLAVGIAAAPALCAGLPAQSGWTPPVRWSLRVRPLAS